MADSEHSQPEWSNPSTGFAGREHATFNPEHQQVIKMKLGNFCLSLAVKNLPASQAFYEKLGFQACGGDASKNWLVLRNDDGTKVGLFQGMFERNMLDL